MKTWRGIIEIKLATVIIQKWQSLDLLKLIHKHSLHNTINVFIFLHITRRNNKWKHDNSSTFVGTITITSSKWQFTMTLICCSKFSEYKYYFAISMNYVYVYAWIVYLLFNSSLVFYFLWTFSWWEFNLISIRFQCDAILILCMLTL